MIYDVRQVTSYAYASEVGYAHHVLRLTPIDRTQQRVHAAVVDIDPVPVGRREGKDFFGNRLTWIELAEPHDRLIIKVAARVAVEYKDETAALTTAPWQTVRDEVFATTDLSATSPAHFVFPSRLVRLDPEIRDYARASFSPGRAILDGATELMHRIKADFAYEIGATTAKTTPSMSFALRRGVCQDFAHIMIAGLRGLGLPAAYVSGYLRTARESDAVDLQGFDAMHAWVLVWGGAGWHGFDPTNAVAARDGHVVVAVGRDYSDVAPIDGVVFASGSQKLDVSVSVTPINS
jgi:transglutaminase-like putative cysteine protease